MGLKAGVFTLPTPQRTSQLVNDTRFSSIREYVLDSSTLAGTTQLNISDLIVGSVIYRIDLYVINAFSSASGEQHNIEVKKSDGSVLMSSEWNDPNSIGTYVTECYTSIDSANQSLQVIHSLSNMISGSAILRLYMYTNVNTTTQLLTSDNLYYHTMDNNGIDVTA